MSEMRGGHRRRQFDRRNFKFRAFGRSLRMRVLNSQSVKQNSGIRRPRRTSVCQREEKQGAKRRCACEQDKDEEDEEGARAESAEGRREREKDDIF